MNVRSTRTLILSSLLTMVTGCDPGSGIPGSGFIDGIEGSGRRVTSAGVVTAIGSIEVNGVEYDVSGAAITIDGQPARESELEVGNVVIVEGLVESGGATGRAVRVTADNTLAGPIESIGIDQDSFRVLGQSVEIDAATGELISAQNFTEIAWATHVDIATGRPVETPAPRSRSAALGWNPGHDAEDQQCPEQSADLEILQSRQPADLAQREGALAVGEQGPLVQ